MSDAIRSDSWTNGPDMLHPAESYLTTDLNGAVKLRKTDNDNHPLSIYTKFKRTVELGPNHIALVTEENGVWTTISYANYWELCMQAAKSFIKFGLQPSHCVAIMGFNAPAWVISMFGAIFTGGISCGIYTTNSADACEHILRNCGARIVIVENQTHLDKILKCQQTCRIDKIVQYTGTVQNSHNGLICTWNEFLEYGRTITDTELAERVKTIAPNKCATLIYTSGTTGLPKAAMLSHDNICSQADFMSEVFQLKMFRESCVSFLPLSHIVAQLLDCTLAVANGFTVYFARPDALKGTLVNTLTHAQPTIFFGVPRVWEKLEDKIKSSLAELTKPKKKLLKWASQCALAHIQAAYENRSSQTIAYSIANRLILTKIKKQIGLNRAKVILSGAAPISSNTMSFFIGLGLRITEAYGLSESTGPITAGHSNRNRLGSAGFENRFNRLRISTDGEVCVYGRNVFMGYLDSPDKTRDTFDNDGYLRTGDIGHIDGDQFLFITGRLKELIITAGGENVSPIPIEDTVKQELGKFVSSCMLVGDKQKFIVLLVTLKTKVNLNTLESLDDLSDECVKHLQSIGSLATKVSDIVNNKRDPLYATINAGIGRANEKAVSNVAKIKKFAILPKDFSIHSGELSNTFKLKRSVVLVKYASIIDELYATDNTD